jgi:chaperonin GroES
MFSEPQHTHNGSPHVHLRPIRNRVVVRPSTVTEQTPGGIWIPPTAREAPREGTVLAIGGDVAAQLGTHTPKPGDRVLLRPLEGDLVRLAGEELLVLEARHVLAVIDG